MKYDKNLLSKLLKSKIAKTKSKKEIIDELLRYLDKENQKALKNVLDELFLMIVTRKDDPNLETLIQNKINALELNIPNLDYEMIYEKFADNALPKDKFSPPTFSFDEIDIRSLEVMRKNFYWMKNDYNEKVSSELKGITEKVFNGEIPRTEMASVLKEQFKGVLSANTSYFKGVSDHIISQMQNIARVNQASKYSVAYYKVVARIDGRTSECCKSMNGRIIPASHIEAQSQAIQNAKNIAEKKAAAIWRSEPFYGKILPKNFGLPPYHFRCRTEIVPVWIDEEEIDGVVMKNTSPLNKDEIIKHIDKTGVERVLSKDNYYGKNNHSLQLNKRTSKINIVRALNSINTVAKNANNSYINAFSDNGYFIVFNGDEIVTCFKPNESKKKSFDYFKNASEYDKKEVIKWKIANLL
ncbi:TPA: hypothetical protein RPV57_001288 [Campylobacter fetus]|uniref:hypothetical protein n=1 Tax=Campylobacter fetus TaxID=196 RepID=UPI000509143A|nr:hypothetical protein [Campylobacter fetus]WKW16794.1 hypothetical protein IXZ25_05925 [Campylobacter fetus subsp. fetus]AIR79018.1 hypothetical protein CFF04554_1124 [Campylobacter fetus subsp. fetus 04/554]HDX6332116.1 hypothetical protein [Campylobacter fetus]HEF4185618.1 hypothetical protein [Campylobacter fetus]HEG3970345.1 hypothetical protein [Campylobacter fetus]